MQRQVTPPQVTEPASSGNQAPRLERLPSVIARTGLSRTTIWRRSGVDFPAPVRLGENSNSGVAWVSAEVDGWIASRINATRGHAK